MPTVYFMPISLNYAHWAFMWFNTECMSENVFFKFAWRIQLHHQTRSLVASALIVSQSVWVEFAGQLSEVRGETMTAGWRDATSVRHRPKKRTKSCFNASFVLRDKKTPPSLTRLSVSASRWLQILTVWFASLAFIVRGSRVRGVLSSWKLCDRNENDSCLFSEGLWESLQPCC